MTFDCHNNRYLFYLSDYLTHQALKMAPNRRICNELVWELCKEIPTAKTANSILLTAHNMYAYLEPRFSRKNLIYRDAIAFLKAMMKTKKHFCILIDQVAQKNENEPIVVINQKQWDKEFKLETNHFRLHITTTIYNKNLIIFATYGQIESAHLFHFLRLITPLIHPIRLNLCSSIPNYTGMVRFMNKQREWIDSIELWDYHFYLKRIYKALRKYDKLQIDGPLNPDYVPKLIQWLTSNNNKGKSKSLVLERVGLNGGVNLLMDELKKEFASSTSKSRFVVRLKLLGPLDEFTLSNEQTGERLQLRSKKSKCGRYIHTLSRSPDNGMEDNEIDFVELGTCGTDIVLG